jgi:hypothetical protein
LREIILSDQAVFDAKKAFENAVTPNRQDLDGTLLAARFGLCHIAVKEFS